MDVFNFDLLYFWYPLRYRVIQYLIWKLSDVVFMRQECLVLAVLLASFRVSLNVVCNLLHKRGFVKTQSLRTVKSKSKIYSSIKKHLLLGLLPLQIWVEMSRSFHLVIEKTKRYLPGVELKRLCFEPFVC